MVGMLRSRRLHPGTAREAAEIRVSLLTRDIRVDENSGLDFGGVPEWPKGSDCKSDGSAFGGSNPPPSTSKVDITSSGLRGG